MNVFSLHANCCFKPFGNLDINFTTTKYTKCCVLLSLITFLAHSLQQLKCIVISCFLPSGSYIMAKLSLHMVFITHSDVKRSVRLCLHVTACTSWKCEIGIYPFKLSCMNSGGKADDGINLALMLSWIVNWKNAHTFVQPKDE